MEPQHTKNTPTLPIGESVAVPLRNGFLRFDETRETLQIAVPVPNGLLVATPTADLRNPGIDVEFIPDTTSKEDVSTPHVRIEAFANEHRLHALLFTDPQTKDATEDITLATYTQPHCPHYKERCADCAVLVENEGKWYCDELEQPCEEILHCPEGLE